MDTMTFLGFLAITVTGLVALGVILKFLEVDETAVRAGQARRAEAGAAIRSVAVLPAFFANGPADRQVPAAFGFDDELVAMLEAHVKRERAIAATFVHLPSVDSLYRQAQPSPFVRMH
jgi:hypothetical protein